MIDQDQRRSDMAEMAKFRRAWKENFKKKNIVHLIEESERFQELIVRYPYHVHEDAKILQEYFDRIEIMEDKAIKEGQNDCPIAFVKPSWEQAQFLNAWSPEYEPELAPEGYRSLCNFSGVRQGKSAEAIFNNILWSVPNEPDWRIFEEFEDPYGRGKYQVKRRPKWDYYIRTGRMIYEEDEPPKGSNIIWHGCPDENHWKQKLDKEYRKWMPMKWVKRVGSDLQWFVADKYFKTKWETAIIAKLYMSDMMAWSGEEVFLTSFDEGPPKDKLDEAKIRTEFISWSYTAREAANTGDRALVAYKTFTGDPEYGLVGATKFFTNKLAHVPEHIMTSAKKQSRIQIADAMGAAGEVVKNGGFYNSSPAVFSNFSRERNILPISGDLVPLAIRGEVDPVTMKKFPWLSLFEGANIIRGFDEGLVHPTAASWFALLRTGEWVLFKELEAVGLSITERCQRIVGMSGNEIKEVKFGRSIKSEEDMENARMWTPHLMADKAREQQTGIKTKRYMEREVKMNIRRTYADSKMFRRDPNYPLQNWIQNYSRAGLKLEKAGNQHPNERCDYVNDLMRIDQTRLHINPDQRTLENEFGAMFYMTVNCTQAVKRITEYLWQQIGAGPRVGEFTGKPALTGDDLIDAICYPICSKTRWTDMREITARKAQIYEQAA